MLALNHFWLCFGPALIAAALIALVAYLSRPEPPKQVPPLMPELDATGIQNRDYVLSACPEAKCVFGSLYWPGQGTRSRYIVWGWSHMSFPLGEGMTPNEAWAIAAAGIKKIRGGPQCLGCP
jgi:hypothetical protein